MTVLLLSSDMAGSSGVFVRRSSEEPRHYSWHFPSTFAVTIITALEIKCAVEGGGRHGRDGALITSLIVVDRCRVADPRRATGKISAAAPSFSARRRSRGLFLHIWT